MDQNFIKLVRAVSALACSTDGRQTVVDGHKGTFQRVLNFSQNGNLSSKVLMLGAYLLLLLL